MCSKMRATVCRLTIPETNPEMDVYRVGTVLEAVRWGVLLYVLSRTNSILVIQWRV
jgi:hypothetical protein